MRLTLDWDTEADRSENWPAFERAKGDHDWLLRQSSGGEGYHAEVWGMVPDTRAAFENAIIGPGGLREQLGDDPDRLELDRIRWDMGSPFVQVLFDSKYLSRRDLPPYETGQRVEPLEGSILVPDDDRIKDDRGRLDYHQIARQLIDLEYGSQRGLARSLGASSSTVNAWIGGGGISAGYKKKLRRRARHHGLGHYTADKSADRLDDVAVKYIDPGDPVRRSVIEYMDVPWGSDPSDVGDPDREYALAQIETGSINPNHTDGQLRNAHERAVEAVQDALSPTSTINDVTLDLDRALGRAAGWGDREIDAGAFLRHPDSVFTEHALLDPGEGSIYWGNLPPIPDKIDPAESENHVVTELLLWDEGLDEVLWHVQIIDDADDWSDHAVLTDDRGWWQWGR